MLGELVARGEVAYLVLLHWNRGAILFEGFFWNFMDDKFDCFLFDYLFLVS